MDVMPKWADALLIPLISILLAFAISALVILAIGEDPVAALKIMVEGTFGRSEGCGLHAFLCHQLHLHRILPWPSPFTHGCSTSVAKVRRRWADWVWPWCALRSRGRIGLLALPFAIIGGALFGALWALIPAYLQAKRGSHIVITTIMFNFIASALLVYLLVEVLKPAGSMDPASARFPVGTNLPTTVRYSGRDWHPVFSGGPCQHHLLHRADRLFPFLASDLAHAAWL